MVEAVLCCQRRVSCIVFPFHSMSHYSLSIRHNDTGGGKPPIPIPADEELYYDWAFSDCAAAKMTGISYACAFILTRVHLIIT